MGNCIRAGKSKSNVSVSFFLLNCTVPTKLCSFPICSLHRRAMESDDEEEETAANTIPSEELNLVVRELTVRLENLKTCYDLITKHGAALQRALSELESGEDLVNKNKIVSERATLFRISSNAMINVSKNCLIERKT